MNMKGKPLLHRRYRRVIVYPTGLNFQYENLDHHKKVTPTLKTLTLQIPYIVENFTTLNQNT